MKTTAPMNPLAAFPVPGQPPAEADLPSALGPAWPGFGEVLQRLHAAHPRVTAAWQYSRQSGWYQVQLLKKRRLLYLVPQRGGYRLMMILGRKAVASLQAGPYASRLEPFLKNARHYPEGIAFEFGPDTLEPDLILGLLEAKLSPQPALA